MQSSRGVGVAYALLCKGVHLSEIQRFVHAVEPAIDVEADTVPAPPPDMRDPDTYPTPLSPRPGILAGFDAAESGARELFSAEELADHRGVPESYWEDVAELVETEAPEVLPKETGFIDMRQVTCRR